MTALIYYASRSGNTRRVAEAIAEGLRRHTDTEVRAVGDGPGALRDDLSLVIVGGPTEGHGMNEEMSRFLDRLPGAALAGRAAAAFDTRLDWPRWLSGSAADGIRQRLERAGARLPLATESFIVSMKPQIAPAELERAVAWGDALGAGVPDAAGAPA
jgi:flavodoxin